jgi:hypothetical protein
VRSEQQGQGIEYISLYVKYAKEDHAPLENTTEKQGLGSHSGTNDRIRRVMHG